MGVNVDKEELLKALAYDRHQYEQGYSDGIRARDEEIVRCKDCQWWDQRINKKSENHRCFSLGRWTSPEWFCADGERKETEDDND